MHDSVKIPFVLLPGAQNESQFAFTLEQINMPQKIKGTLTYMVKVRFYAKPHSLSHFLLLSTLLPD